MDSRQKRFRVALSYPGEHREYVSRVADLLAERLGRDRVLYDKYHEAEFARIDLDTYLQRLYHDESELIVVFLSANYERKEWPGLEWRAIRDIIKRRRESTVVPVRFDDTEIPGLFSTAGSLWIGEREPETIADLILQRLHLERGPASAGERAIGAKIAPTRLRHSAEKLIGREDELARLEAAWADPATRVLTIVAFGGVGKTSLVAHWAARLAQRGYDGADYFDWSFYSQGTREQGGASADQFINRALEFFGDMNMAAGAASPWDKGERLAQLVAERRALLVLDGLEPLQYPPSHPMKGELRDPAVATLLKGLAQRNPGLCVVTTREHVSDLAAFRPTTAPELPLHHLSTTAGVELLRTLGVQGNAQDLEALAKDVRGHALTLNLLGSYLVRAHDGDVRRRDQVRIEKADDAVQGGHAFKAMAAYERWLGPPESRKRWWWPFSRRSSPVDQAGARQLAILRLMGLFDRPADAACLDALRRPPGIAGLTEPIVDLADDDWNLAVTALADSGLVSVPEAAASGSLDAHPLVREYFAKRLRDHAPEAWREAHSRLYEHLRDSVEPQPETLNGLQPLYEAVVHGCYAQRHQEACDSVYWDRILRGKAYSMQQLGAFGANLGAMACFFDHPWIKVSPLLKPPDQAWLLGNVAFSLRALGRLSEALPPMRAGLEMRVEEKAWKNAAVVAGNLSELDLTVGDVESAVVDATQAVLHADRSSDAFQRMFQRTTLAEAVKQSGGGEAMALFREADALQVERQPEYPFLYSLQGFRYSDLLLSEPERNAWRYMIGWRPANKQVVDKLNEATPFSDLEDRTVQTLRLAEEMSFPLLDIALDHLTLGRALLYRFVVEANATVISHVVGSESLIDSAATRNHLDAAVDGLRRAGQIDYLPRGLLSRAWLRFLRGDRDGAWADLDEAGEIAERGPMRLHVADIHLYRARLFYGVQPYPWVSPHADLAAARELIEKCGYWRRKEELEDAEAAAENW